MNAMDVVEKKKRAAKAQKIPVAPGVDDLAWCDQVAVVETDNMANLERYQYKVGNLGRRYSSPLVAQRCSNLVRAHVLPPATGDFDLVNAVTNPVVQAVRKLYLPFWLPLRELGSWSDYADQHHGDSWTVAGFPAREDEGRHPRRRPRGAVPDIEHAESARWLRALSTESRLLRWIACSDFGSSRPRSPDPKIHSLRLSVADQYLPRRRTTWARGVVLGLGATALGFTTGLWLAAAPCREGGAWSYGWLH